MVRTGGGEGGGGAAVDSGTMKAPNGEGRVEKPFVPYGGENMKRQYLTMKAKINLYKSWHGLLFTLYYTFLVAKKL